jgi:hypothetical protein
MSRWCYVWQILWNIGSIVHFLSIKCCLLERKREHCLWVGFPYPCNIALQHSGQLSVPFSLHDNWIWFYFVGRGIDVRSVSGTQCFSVHELSCWCMQIHFEWGADAEKNQGKRLSPMLVCMAHDGGLQGMVEAFHESVGCGMISGREPSADTL